MYKTLLAVGLGNLALLGAALIYWSRQLSLRYNGWTTRIRERHPTIIAPPTPEARELNTKLMMWLFRLLGAWLVLLSVLSLSAIWHSR
jgi:hypothetical protein